FLVVQLVCVLALTTARQGGRAGGKEAGAQWHVISQRAVRSKGFGVESGGGSLEVLELTARKLTRKQSQALVIVLRFVFAPPEGWQVRDDQRLCLTAEHMAVPTAEIARLNRPPVVAKDRRRERLSGFRQVSNLVQGHGKDYAGDGHLQSGR